MSHMSVPSPQPDGGCKWREGEGAAVARWASRDAGNVRCGCRCRCGGGGHLFLKKGSALNKVDRQGDEGISIVQQIA